ncbi:MAG TPA: hypothetical protein VG917_05985 [Patescibacteria group bacterium]|nr:hypothetical protein [Patescibacteria group bacterium]
MKKLSAISSIIAFGALSTPAFADVLDAGIKTPAGSTIIDPNTSVGSLVSFLIAFIIVVAFLFALAYIVIGAFQWITSGGDKQKVADARNHILAAVMGLIIIALSFVIINVVLTALGLGSITSLHIPTLSQFK